MSCFSEFVIRYGKLLFIEGYDDNTYQSRGDWHQETLVAFLSSTDISTLKPVDSFVVRISDKQVYQYLFDYHIQIIDKVVYDTRDN